MKFIFLTVLFCFASALATFLPVQAAEPPHDFSVWSAGSGNWTDEARWSNGLPDAYQRAEVHGDSDVLVPTGTYLIGDLEIGLKARDPRGSKLTAAS